MVRKKYNEAKTRELFINFNSHRFVLANKIRDLCYYTETLYRIIQLINYWLRVDDVLFLWKHTTT